LLKLIHQNMKKRILSLILTLSIGFVASYAQNTINIGESSEGIAFEVEELNGTKKMLRSYSGSRGLLVIFSCNTCPFVVAWEDRYNELYDLCKKNNFEMVLINSNEAFRGDKDSPQAMKDHVKKQGYKMPYVLDNNHRIADAFGAKTTPHVFLFDSNLKLIYKGAIDDNHKDKNAVTKHYLADAIKSAAKNDTPNPDTTNAVGCSIKRTKK
jgi:thioredoxin-related protein